MSNISADQFKELLQEYGFASKDLAQVLGLNVPTFKTFSKGEQPLPEITAQQLDKFYHMVNRLYIIRVTTTVPPRRIPKTVVASWFDAPFELGDGYRITPWDVFRNNDLDSAEKYFALILVNQIVGQPINEVLNDALPGWEESRSDWEVFTNVDGKPSIRLREPDVI